MLDRVSRVALSWTLLSLAAAGAGADSVSVPVVELRELSGARYEIEAELAPAFVFGARRPIPPPRCSVTDPERITDDDMVRITWTFECGDEPLHSDDVLVLPWTAVDGVQLTATWQDGEARRGLFGREPVGVVVRMHLILTREPSLLERLYDHGAAGFTHAIGSVGHWLVIAAFAFASASKRTAWGAIAAFAAGHALSLPLAELGIVGLPLGPADALLSGVAAILMSEWIRTGGLSGASVVGMGIAGLLHGLGGATDSIAAPQGAVDLVTPTFFFDLGVDAAHGVIAAAALGTERLLRPGRERRLPVTASALGVAAMVTLLSGLVEGLRPPIPPADESSNFTVVEAAAVSPAAAVNLETPPVQLDAQGALTAPFMSYLVVEPYQVRHEVLVDVKSVRDWIDVEVEKTGVIPLDVQESLTSSIAALVVERSPVRIDGSGLEPASRRADFVELSVTGALTRDRPVPEPLADAIVGVTLVYETTGLADSVSLDWGLFPDGAPAVPLTVTDPLTVTEMDLTAETPGYSWRNTLGGFELPRIEAIAADSPRLPLVPLALVLVALGAFSLARRSGVALACVAAAYLSYPFVRVEANVPFLFAPRIDREDASKVMERLLTNVYRCFDIHNEDAIYDRLALTVTGEQLLDVYLESRRALELENRGGARVRIDEVVVREVSSIIRTDDGGYALDAVWTVGGSVNHFGHVHFRQNRYDAILTIVPVDDTWKIRRVELQEERRVL